MASLIDPRCGAPTYTLENESIAETCGRYSGYIWIGVIDIILFIIILISWYNNKDLEKKGEKPSYTLIYVCSTLIALSFLLPFLFGLIQKRSWQSTQVQIDGLIKRGYTREKALEELAQNERTTQMTNAMNTNTYAQTGLLASILAKK